MYVLIRNNSVQKYPYSIRDLKKDNKNVSFPKEIDNLLLSKFNVYPVKYIPEPEINYTKNIKELSPVFESNEWVQKWEINDATAEEINERTQEHSQYLRSLRDSKLANSDWTQVADAPVDKTAWATYRQALRDVPEQAGFPWDVTWPSQPE